MIFIVISFPYLQYNMLSKNKIYSCNYRAYFKKSLKILIERFIFFECCASFYLIIIEYRSN
ncbi:hypothetical protein BBU118A_AB28 (plasmid) [Borreliella burgdorferi 118a]|uniref:Uncharacterized protein n=1 Tax=Borreliella burgdorferi 118a TaxID=476210 RepID=A0A7U3YAY3_BORBG|nr:hypothetical protein BBU118A_M28 [Borreliella burgdorferi 118a]ACN93208.1 hypothetical protein BBU118A_AB28 [Borreliella burgdorferi 118a]